jgi:Zn-dependent M28 family amino/carboxypeptidase
LARALAVAGAAFALGGGCGGDSGEGGGAGPTPDHGFDAQRAYRDVAAQVRIGPRPAGSPGSAETVEFIAKRLREAGVGDVQVQDGLRNVVGRLGHGPGTIVIGAHHDTKDIPGFVGANDGASGVAVVLEVARAAGRLVAEGKLGGSYTFVLFDGEEARGDRPFEEDGTRGSRQFVELAEEGGGQGAPPIEEIEAMFLLDLVGDCDLSIPREGNSDPDLYDLLEGEAFGGETDAVLDDHIPFREAGVPAVDIIDFQFGPGPPPGGHWHTTEDTLDKVCPESLDQAGEAVLGALLKLDR